jgi:hypothetical protein
VQGNGDGEQKDGMNEIERIISTVSQQLLAGARLQVKHQSFWQKLAKIKKIKHGANTLERIEMLEKCRRLSNGANFREAYDALSQLGRPSEAVKQLVEDDDSTISQLLWERIEKQYAMGDKSNAARVRTKPEVLERISEIAKCQPSLEQYGSKTQKLLSHLQKAYTLCSQGCSQDVTQAVVDRFINGLPGYCANYVRTKRNEATSEGSDYGLTDAIKHAKIGGREGDQFWPKNTKRKFQSLQTGVDDSDSDATGSPSSDDNDAETIAVPDRATKKTKHVGVCYDFQNGRCTRAVCRYEHALSQNKKKKRARTETTGKAHCKFFQKGACKKGDSCTWLHELKSSVKPCTRCDQNGHYAGNCPNECKGCAKKGGEHCTDDCPTRPNPRSPSTGQ